MISHKDSPSSKCTRCGDVFALKHGQCIYCLRDFHLNCSNRIHKDGTGDLNKNTPKRDVICGECEDKCFMCNMRADNGRRQCMSCIRVFHEHCYPRGECSYCRQVDLLQLKRSERVNIALFGRFFGASVHNPRTWKPAETVPVESVYINGQEERLLHPGTKRGISDTTFYCHRCFAACVDGFELDRHLVRCRVAGREIYRDQRCGISIVAYSGLRSKETCMRLCGLGILFIDHKTLYYEVESFFFYVMYLGDRFVGYFSREAGSVNNLSCILVLPMFQGCGYGWFLIDISYKLSTYRGEIGSPEKPLSKGAQRVYYRYWMTQVYNFLDDLAEANVSIESISANTGVSVDDVVIALEQLGFLQRVRSKYVIEFRARGSEFITQKHRAEVDKTFFLFYI